MRHGLHDQISGYIVGQITVAHGIADQPQPDCTRLGEPLWRREPGIVLARRAQKRTPQRAIELRITRVIAESEIMGAENMVDAVTLPLQKQRCKECGIRAKNLKCVDTS